MFAIRYWSSDYVEKNGQTEQTLKQSLSQISTDTGDDVLSEETVDAAAEVAISKDCLITEAANGNAVENKSENDTIKSNIVKVNATVEINTYKDLITKEEGNLLVSILKSKDHLRRNLKGVLYGTCTTNRNQEGGYKHFWTITIDVEASHLWENARSYVYHHLGRQSWKLGDGTEVRLTRIHSK